MKTVETKVATFEDALEPVRKLDIPMGTFLQAHPEFAKPIPRERLREILKNAGKDEVPFLWSIHHAYGHLEREEDRKDHYQKEKDLIWCRIEEIVIESLKLPENQDLLGAYILYKHSPEESDAEKLALAEIRIQVGKLRPAIALAELEKAGPFFLDGFDTKKVLAEIIRQKALDGIRLATKDRNALSYLERSQKFGLTYSDRYATLKRIVEKKSEHADRKDRLEVLMMVVKLLKECQPFGTGAVDPIDRQKRHLYLELLTWRQVLELTDNKKVLYLAITALAEHNNAHWKELLLKAVLKLFNSHGNADEQNLELVEKYSREQWEYWSEDFKIVVDLIQAGYNGLLASSETSDFPRKVYKKFKDVGKRGWKYPIMLAAVRRLYELQKLSQSK